MHVSVVVRASVVNRVQPFTLKSHYQDSRVHIALPFRDKSDRLAAVASRISTVCFPRPRRMENARIVLGTPPVIRSLRSCKTL